MLLVNEYGTIFNLDKIAVIELSDNAKDRKVAGHFIVKIPS